MLQYCPASRNFHPWILVCFLSQRWSMSVFRKRSCLLRITVPNLIPVFGNPDSARCVFTISPSWCLPFFFLFFFILLRPSPWVILFLRKLPLFNSTITKKKVLWRIIFQKALVPVRLQNARSRKAPPQFRQEQDCLAPALLLAFMTSRRSTRKTNWQAARETQRANIGIRARRNEPVHIVRFPTCWMQNHREAENNSVTVMQTMRWNRLTQDRMISITASVLFSVYLILRVSTHRVLCRKTDSQCVDFDSMWPHPNRYNKDNRQEIEKTSGNERANTITCELFDRLFTRLPLSSSLWDKEHHLYSYPGKCSQPVNPTKVLANLLKA